MSTITTPIDGTDAAMHPTATAGISLLATGPACVVCGVPFLWPALAAMGLGASPLIAHYLSWVLVPVLVVLLVRNARRHGDRRPLRLAKLGAAIYVVHVVVHFVPVGGDVVFGLTDYVAVALLGTAALWDLAITRRIRREMSRVRRDVPVAGGPAL